MPLLLANDDDPQCVRRTSIQHLSVYKHVQKLTASSARDDHRDQHHLLPSLVHPLLLLWQLLIRNILVVTLYPAATTAEVLNKSFIIIYATGPITSN